MHHVTTIKQPFPRALNYNTVHVYTSIAKILFCMWQTDSITSSDRIFCEKRLTAGSSPMVSSVTYICAALLPSAVYTFKP